MPQADMFKRYLDAGMAFTQMTRERAEAIVKDLVQAGEVRRKNTEELIEELLERSRKNTDELLGTIRREIADQLKALGLDDLARRTSPPEDAGPARATDASGVIAGTARAKKAAQAEVAAVRAAPKRAPKKAAAGKATSKTATKKTSASKTTAKKSGAAKKGPA